jgi:hypothetical protein
MRPRFVFRHALLLAVPLAGASCASPPPAPGYPVPAQLTDRQADVLARAYLDAKPVNLPRMLGGEEKIERGWWLWYHSPFDPAGKPPVASYLVQVDNDGTVRDIE